ncbi:MAG: OmpA family protein [Saprospiraceae bacterium]
MNEASPDYIEIADRAGIFWYFAGRFPNLEEAEKVQQQALDNGFKHPLIIDEEEQRILADTDCPYIRNGVVFCTIPIRIQPKTIYCRFGSSSLNAESRATLDEVYHRMKEVPTATLDIEGFTYAVGDARSNMVLAATRSRAARDYLIYKGLRADKMLMKVFGEAAPAAPNYEDDGSNKGKGRDLPENRKWNRRVTLTLNDASLAPKGN